MMNINKELQEFVEKNILPIYDQFDEAHRRDHAEKVIRDSLALSKDYDVDVDMVFAIAAYHDTGLQIDRTTHHMISGRIVREDKHLGQWFSDSQIEIMAQAVEDHRASATRPPRSVYGRIVAEADRNIDIPTIIRRSIQYGLAHYPELDFEEQIRRAHEHLNEKYGPNGYLKLWIPGSENERKLHELWTMMEDFDKIDGIVREIANSLI